MCIATVYEHPCGHMSTHWNYCANKTVDLRGNIEPCDKADFGRRIKSPDRCALPNCAFADIPPTVPGKVWQCCKCQKANRNIGFCKARLQTPRMEFGAWTDTCDHGCCKNC
ncbi:hypothetical protein QBC46DRAFT_243474, partial [Diplogelasinospora grovesii]